MDRKIFTKLVKLLSDKVKEGVEVVDLANEVCDMMEEDQPPQVAKTYIQPALQGNNEKPAQKVVDRNPGPTRKLTTLGIRDENGKLVGSGLL